jgi:hypothetical protein
VPSRRVGNRVGESIQNNGLHTTSLEWVNVDARLVEIFLLIAIRRIMALNFLSPSEVLMEAGSEFRMTWVHSPVNEILAQDRQFSSRHSLHHARHRGAGHVYPSNPPIRTRCVQSVVWEFHLVLYGPRFAS